MRIHIDLAVGFASVPEWDKKERAAYMDLITKIRKAASSLNAITTRARIQGEHAPVALDSGRRIRIKLREKE